MLTKHRRYQRSIHIHMNAVALQPKNFKTMRNESRRLLLQCLAMGACGASQLAFAAEGIFFGRTVGYLGGGDSRPCVFFVLDGVPEAVAAIPNSGWFVLPKTHSQFKESFALLLAAKLTGRQVNVTTTGNVHACGHAEVFSIGLN